MKTRVFPLESKIQESCFTWFWTQYPNYYRNIYHTPNGGIRNKITASKLKKGGVLSGVWDIFFTLPRCGYNGLFIEIKRPKEKLTENQILFRDSNNFFFKFVICYSLDDFIKEIEIYLKDGKL